MRYTITFSEEIYRSLITHLFIDRTVERAAYGLCRISQSENECRLLVRKIIPIAKDEIESSSKNDIKIRPNSFIRAIKEADNTNQSFLFIHSHPEGFMAHSKQDDEEEIKLFRTVYIRIKSNGIHGSLVLSNPDLPIARIWLNNSTVIPVDIVRVIGNRFKFYTNLQSVDPLPTFFDRQIRAFGSDMQRLLKVLRVGVVGAGGTGSATIEQLIRLGVGNLSIFDKGTFESTNVNRVYGSTINDGGRKKVEIVANHSKNIGLRTNITLYDNSITFKTAINKLKECDVIFGCTDDNWGRSILNRIAIYYYIPVFDMGVKIDSQDGNIRSIQGRVTTLLARNACLLCRERITTSKIKVDQLLELNPTELENLQKEGYTEELDTPAPSVIPFTTNIASLAVTEFIHRLTGFMGAERCSNETIMRFDESKLSTNSRKSKDICICGNEYNIMRGDVDPLLDITWRDNEN